MQINDEIENLSDLDIRKKWNLQDFEIGPNLGSGRFGRVYVVKENRTKYGCILALKVFRKKMLEKEECKEVFKNEYETQIKLRHPNILKLHGFFHTDEKIYLMLDYCPNGTLYNMMDGEAMENDVSATYICQITKALVYLHEKDIVHQDLKPENILIGQWNQAILCDFGFAAISSDLDEDDFKQPIGTLDYLSPEIVKLQPHGIKVDIWCLGVLSYELLVGKPPFMPENEENDELNTLKETKRLICSVQYITPKNLKRSAVDFIGKLLKKEPCKRPNAPEILEHKWLVQFADQNNEYEKYFYNHF